VFYDSKNESAEKPTIVVVSLSDVIFSSSEGDFTNKDIFCHGKILNVLFDNIYHIFYNIKMFFKLWEGLEYKYGIKNKFLKSI